MASLCVPLCHLPCLEGNGLETSDFRDRKERTLLGQKVCPNMLFIAALTCHLPYFLAYLVLSVSKQIGIYLSNRMVRLALSVWISLLSIQLLTGGFHPKSPGLMYRIPVSIRNIVVFHGCQYIFHPRELFYLFRKLTDDISWWRAVLRTPRPSIGSGGKKALID